MAKARSLIGTLLIALLVSHTIISDVSTVQSVYTNGMNPGMAVRLEQKSIDSFKRAMQEFLPKYISNDAVLPTEYSYTVGLIADFLTWKFTWRDIKYSDAVFDINDIKLVLNRMYDT